MNGSIIIIGYGAAAAAVDKVTMAVVAIDDMEAVADMDTVHIVVGIALMMAAVAVVAALMAVAAFQGRLH